MKRISFFLALTLLVFSFGLANAAQEVTIDHIDGSYVDGGTKLVDGANITFHLRITNTDEPGCKYAPSFMFVISSTDGATWGGLGMAFPAIYTLEPFPGIFVDYDMTDMFASFFPDPFEVWGPGGNTSDSVGFAGVAFGGDTALFYGMDEIAFEVSTGAVASNGSGTLCIDFGGQAHGGFEWAWNALDNATAGCNGSQVIAGWGGPYCYAIDTPPDFAPVLTNAPVTLEGSHCEVLSFDFDIEDPDPGAGPQPDLPLTFSVDIGTIDANTGEWTYSGDLGQVGSAIVLTVVGHENDNALTDTALVNIVMTNDAPTITSGCGLAPIIAGTGTEIIASLTGEDSCPGDPMTFEIVSTNAVGAAAFVGGDLVYTPADDDAVTDGGAMCFTVQVTDGVDASATCEVCFAVSAGAPYGITIEKVHDQIQGVFGTVDITLDPQAEPLGGYNLLIAYDASALTFQGATPGTLLSECGWEYFTYRFGADGNCSGGCPSGLLRLTAIAETNNGPNHPVPGCNPEGSTLATLSFLVTNDRTLNCQFVPIRFFWIECGDNTLTNESGEALYIAATVKDYGYEYAGYSNLMEEYPNAVLPTFVGPMGCLTSDKVDVKAWIDFFNGGIDIICSDSIDGRGDINLDGLGYTIADAVMFSNYFIQGMTALVNVAPYGFAASVAASDVNADGLTLTVADLVYLIRVVVGDALPYPKVAPQAIEANLYVGNNTLGVADDAAMGGAYVVLAGDVTPTLLADNMEMKFAYDGVNTRVLVYSTENHSFAGDFLGNVGNVISTELATVEGSTVSLSKLPVNFELGQNYPNPFNPSTSIELSLPAASDYSLVIYNVTGQVVTEFNGSAEAGFLTITYDASNTASGVYFYKLTAGNFTETKKMVLMK